MNRFSLENRVALVTGAGRGIGKALALGLAQEGAHVVCLSRTAAEVEATAQQIREQGRRALAVTADIAVKAQIDAAVAAAVAEFGQIDILVNNAGMNIRTPALEVTEQDWDTVVPTNLRGPFFVAQTVGRHMCQQGSGRIINISSVGGAVALLRFDDGGRDVARAALRLGA
ncbi:MAG TPA: SDR family NAD(P)-dependent oxidoreductase, partial [Symbiobacteriaceae bacterium]|nr:SDR family NAD(P)-dependent oxidoreductase [Symbiobacteriaceae bacterium]